MDERVQNCAIGRAGSRLFAGSHTDVSWHHGTAAPSPALLSPWLIAAEGLAEDVDRLFERRARSGRFAKRVEHEEVVDDAVEPDAGCAHPGFDELARVGL